ncbi:hypothetical protein P4117_27285 [Pseudomonas aeruginosa]|nr:hypothetical protein [Pseudomonas aeruginosa]MDF5967289.1 hypothetical protein [Pseudomonas aeruginosa]MDF5971739.1 hypothetical protein [Pseudomonas aeruginosa]MDF5974538.1 hypothetical protein [Pseudomonas aeruginosa]
MYWIEICTDGSYVVDGQEFPLLSEGIEQLESNDGERSGSDWVKYSTPFELETEHGVFVWEVQLIEYLKLSVVSLLGSRIIKYPNHVLLKDEVMFRIQDGWAYPKEPTLDLKPQVTKIRLV